MRCFVKWTTEMFCDYSFQTSLAEAQKVIEIIHEVPASNLVNQQSDQIF